MIVTSIALFSFTIVSIEAFAHYGEPLSGYGTANIDGIRSLGEWDGAHIISVFGDKSDSSMLLVMNDEDNLYIALYVIDSILTPNDQFGIMFDNSHNGVFDVNDDSGGFSGLGISGDGYFNGTEWIADSKTHGKGAAQNDGSRNFMEFSKPLKSGDENDFNLSIGDTVGFCVTYVREGIATDSTQYGPACRLLINDQKLYGDIVLTPFSINWHGLMAMDATKRNVDFGETIDYQGYLYGDNLVKDQVVTITISEQETGTTILTNSLVPSSESIDYFENTAWTFSFEVDTSQNDFTDGYSYVVEAKYVEKSTKLNFLIKPDTKPDLKEKASDAGEAIVEAGSETSELVIEAGKEAGKVIIDAGGEAAEKGVIVGEIVAEKSKETGQVIMEKGSEGIEEIQEKGGGCLIATAAYGTELAPQIQFLREVRDNVIMSTESGTAFMMGFNQLYYSFSPTIADIERENPTFQEGVRVFIIPMISTLSIMTLAEEGNDIHIVGLGMLIVGLNLGLYVVSPVIIGFIVHKKIKISKKII